MKNLLDWKTKEVVNIYDEISLWSAPFGQVLLEHIPMKKGASIVDIGFGTGFPLIELSQRFGEGAKLYGVDIWDEAINRTKEKIRVLGIDTIQIIEASATHIPLEDDSIDLVTSNLGINNFEDRKEVYAEIHRILKKDGSLCITTNPTGTFDELFQIMMRVCDSMNLEKAHASLKDYVNNRSTKEQIIEEFGNNSFELVNKQETVTKMRFVDAKAIFDHSLIRIGFRAYWEQMIQEANRDDFFDTVIQEIEKEIAIKGVFEMTVPILYLEFGKRNT